MIRVVMDTNVIVSAALSQEGNPALIMRMILLDEIKNSTTQEIIAEVKEVLERPKITKKMIIRFLNVRWPQQPISLSLVMVIY